MLRHSAGRPPQLTFTSDFHQLVQGDLIPGPCTLRYDPLRLITADNCNERHEIRIWLRFHPVGGNWEGTLIVPPHAKLADLADPAAQGFMLESDFPLPQGCEEIEAWFCCKHHGRTDWDSNHGQNYRLRFALRDVYFSEARVRPLTPASAVTVFALAIDTHPAVESAQVRWRVPSDPPGSEHSSSLSMLPKPGSRKHWTTTILTVPENATVVFELVYFIGGRRFTDDNQGRWYVAD